MVNTVLGWFQAQEVALAWAVVKYAELVSMLTSGTSLAAAGWCCNEGRLSLLLAA
jgi:hypothetical protein